MPFKISGHDSVRNLSTRREAAIDAIARAAKMMRQGFQGVRITDMTTGRTYNSDKFHLIVRRASGTAAIWHRGPTLHPSKFAGEIGHHRNYSIFQKFEKNFFGSAPARGTAGPSSRHL
jgi:hypothetical protein